MRLFPRDHGRRIAAGACEAAQRQTVPEHRCILLSATRPLLSCCWIGTTKKDRECSLKSTREYFRKCTNVLSTFYTRTAELKATFKDRGMHVAKSPYRRAGRNQHHHWINV